MVTINGLRLRLKFKSGIELIFGKKKQNERLILKFKTNQILPENIQSEYVYFNLTVVEVA